MCDCESRREKFRFGSYIIVYNNMEVDLFVKNSCFIDYLNCSVVV